MKHLVEFFELHKILGVTKFVIYNHSIGEESSKYLNHYEKIVLLISYNGNFQSMLMLTILPKFQCSMIACIDICTQLNILHLLILMRLSYLGIDLHSHGHNSYLSW